MRLIRSASFQLTLWYLGIIMVLSVLFSVALYRVSYGQLAANAEHQRIAIERLPLPLGYEDRRAAFTQALADQLDAAQRTILFRLLALNLGTLLLGGGAAYALALRTLRPIEEAMEAQGRFTADASHELRTPLTAMRSEIEVALRAKQLSPADARALLGSNLEEIAKLETLSAGLLRLARSENGLDPAVLSPVSVKDMFEGAIDRYQAQLAERHIKLDVKAGDETIEGDHASLIELIAILLDNAIKYSPSKTTIAMHSNPTDSSVHISVTDQGAGINASDIPHIFDRFYRADHSRTRGEHVGGYGLGLSIAGRITDLHHGHIAVSSVPGKGTTFRIKFPVKYQPPKTLFK